MESNGSADHHIAYLLPYSGWSVVDKSPDSIGLNISHLRADVLGRSLDFWLQTDVDEIDVPYLRQPGGGTFSCYGQNTLLATIDTASEVRSAGMSVVHWSPTVQPVILAHL